MEEKIKQLLTAIVHPETGQDIVTSGFIEHTAAAARQGDGGPALRQDARPVRPEDQETGRRAPAGGFPGSEVLVVIKEGGAAPRPEPKLKTTTGRHCPRHRRRLGQGRSRQINRHGQPGHCLCATWATGVGILDADIYGPSQPKMFGVEGYLPKPCRRMARTGSSRPARWRSN